MHGATLTKCCAMSYSDVYMQSDLLLVVCCRGECCCLLLVAMVIVVAKLLLAASCLSLLAALKRVGRIVGSRRVVDCC